MYSNYPYSFFDFSVTIPHVEPSIKDCRQLDRAELGLEER